MRAFIYFVLFPFYLLKIAGGLCIGALLLLISLLGLVTGGLTIDEVEKEARDHLSKVFKYPGTED